MPFNQNPLEQQQYVAYLDLSGGRNTKKDPHALDRNQLVISDNTWMAQGNTIAKRPGNISLSGISAGTWGTASAGATGLGVSLKAMVEGRFFNQTALVVQGQNNQLAAVPMNLPGISSGVNSWVSIGAVSGGIIQAAQLFDPGPSNPNGPDGTLFIVDGVDTPKVWLGPGNPIKPALLGPLPLKNGVNSPITPAYVATLFSSLFYAGEPTDPSCVYISDPFRPQSFTSNLVVPAPGVTQGGTPITTSGYIGAYIGRGDGVNGGNITGLAALGSAMVVYKQSAIYLMTQVGILGDTVWGSSVLSSSVGMLSPRSLVAFDTFHCILGIDGAYVINANGTSKISSNNPDLFDGPTAMIADRTTAIGVRYGNRYILFFDDGGGTSTPVGHPTRAAWFDFDKTDADGLPCVGTFSAMNVNGVAPLRGPADTGNFAWVDATRDRVGVFAGVMNGVTVSSDFGAPIMVSVFAKADMFSDVWGSEAPVDIKAVDAVQMLLSFPIITSNQTYIFNGTIYYDQLNALNSVGLTTQLNFPNQSTVGTAVVGTAVVGLLTGTPAYEAIPLFQPANSSGLIVQYSFSESSIFPWTSLGFLLLVNRQLKVGSQSG